MKIKDVEKLTGLSQRSIRLYEEKGLINPSRDEENQYRSYTDDNLEKLKMIRVLRYLDFSIDEIGDLLRESSESDEVLIETLKNKSEQFIDASDDYKDKSQACRVMIRALNKRSMINSIKSSEKKMAVYKAIQGNDKDASNLSTVLDEFIEEIDTYDDEENQEVRSAIKYLEHPSLGATLFWTVIFSAPLLRAYTDGIVQSRLHITLTIASAIFIAANWYVYIRGRLKRPDYQKERNKGSLWIFPTLIAGICLSLAAFILLSSVQERWLDYILGDKWVFYEEVSWMTWPLIIAISMMTIYPLFALLHHITGHEDYEFASDEIAFLKKHKLIAPVAAIICLYIGFIGMSVVTDNALVKFDAFHPTGKIIPFKEIELVETGFSKRGDFYYKLESDNKRAKFSAPYVNETDYPEYHDEDGAVTYQELVDLDEKLMALGISKKSDTDSVKYADYNEVCMQKFRKIMEEQK